MNSRTILAIITGIYCSFVGTASAQVKLYDMVTQCDPINEVSGNRGNRECPAVGGFLRKNGAKYAELLKKCASHYDHQDEALPEECINASIFELYYPSNHYSFEPNIVYKIMQDFMRNTEFGNFIGTVMTLTNKEDEKIHREVHKNLCLAYGVKDSREGFSFGRAVNVEDLNQVYYNCCLLTSTFHHCMRVRDDVYLYEDGGVDRGLKMKLEALRAGMQDPLTAISLKHELDRYENNLETRRKDLMKQVEDFQREEKLQSMQDDIQL